MSSGAAIWRFQWFWCVSPCFSRKKNKTDGITSPYQSFQARRVVSEVPHLIQVMRPTKGSDFREKKQRIYWSGLWLPANGILWIFYLNEVCLQKAEPTISTGPQLAWLQQRKGGKKTTSGIRDDDNVVILSKSDICKIVLILFNSYVNSVSYTYSTHIVGEIAENDGWRGAKVIVVDVKVEPVWKPPTGMRTWRCAEQGKRAKK